MTASLFDRLRERAVEIHVADHLRARLNRGDKIRVKLGLDPTAPDLHIGHLVVFDVLRAFQDEGHTVVLIIGDYTAQIGDPSGRSETRPMLTAEQVAANGATYLEQVDLVLDRRKTEIHGNSEWLAGMGAAKRPCNRFCSVRISPNGSRKGRR
jgi:tyrosyl-tRNA synthetase